MTAGRITAQTPITRTHQGPTMPKALSTVPDEPVDPFDPEALRVGTLDEVDVERILTAVPVYRPPRSDFFRVHPHPDYCLDTAAVEWETGSQRETYLVLPAAYDAVAQELRKIRLFTCINKRGTVFLWPAKLPRADVDAGRRWSVTALQAAEQGKTLWTKMVGNRDLGGYEMFRAKGDLGEPQWPDRPFRDLLKIAFSDRLIDNENHPVIREINGEL